MLHFGSRNIGAQVADYYNDLAIKINEQWYSSVPKSFDLAFLPIGSDEAREYIVAMNVCLKYAMANHGMAIEKIEEAINKVKPVQILEKFFVHHNYAALENHMGANVWVHRKGATRAYENEIGIIPGSQGTSSYIVKGKGNILSFKSCSHGAGRAMSRTKAQETLNLEAEQKILNDQGILHGIRGKYDLEEASGSYKNIEQVMENQADLVDVVV
jgi:tRNA-splicing ligase RtcB